MKFQSLRFKINAAITLACLIVALFFGAIFSFFEAHRREVRVQEIRLLLSTVFEQKKDEIANEIFARQEDALNISVQNLLQVKGITEIAVHDTDGKPLISTHQELDRILTSRERSALITGASFVRTEFLGRSHAAYATPIEVIGERVGFIRMFYDLEELDMESLRAFWVFVALLVSTLFVMSFLLNKLLHRFVLRPTTMLGEAIARLQKGELGEQIPLLSTDEIGRVAMAFNELSAMLDEQHNALLASMEARQKYAQDLEQANKVLEQLNARLEDMVQERTAELLKSNEQLRTEMNERIKADRVRVELEERLARSQKMEALGLLAGGVAHDLNNVLSGTVSYPDLLLMELPEDSPLRKPIRIIRDSGQKAAAIVQDLLTLARRGVMSMETLDLNEQIIHDYLRSPEHLNLVAQHPDTRIELRLEENLLKIKGSPIHLRKTLMNLIINAMEAQPQGGRITITTQNTFVERPIEGYDAVSIGDYVVLRVEDDGVGIEQADLKRIFEPFYSKKVMGRSGTGLGMAVVWGTVQDHQGYINVHSTPGRGSSFELYFPVTREEVLPEGKALSVDDYLGSGELVLVVDDLGSQREIASQILKRLRYTVVTAASGEDALEFLRYNSCELVLLDMIMEPGMDGLDTYRRIIEIHPGQRAVIASGFAENERVREALSLGVNQYIRKPYTIENLGLAIATALARQRP